MIHRVSHRHLFFFFSWQKVGICVQVVLLFVSQKCKAWVLKLVTSLRAGQKTVLLNEDREKVGKYTHEEQNISLKAKLCKQTLKSTADFFFYFLGANTFWPTFSFWLNFSPWSHFTFLPQPHYITQPPQKNKNVMVHPWHRKYYHCYFTWSPFTQLCVWNRISSLETDIFGSSRKPTWNSSL